MAVQVQQVAAVMCEVCEPCSLDAVWGLGGTLHVALSGRGTQLMHLQLDC
jgi:hypothetical protein